MTEFAIRAGRQFAEVLDVRNPARRIRLLVLLTLLTIGFSSPDLAQVVFQATSDAFLQVTVFVAATLALVYSVERAFAFDIGLFLARTQRWQSFIAALLGAAPGCGGAIIVVTQYTRGYVTFGGVVSVLVATMGDAAFLLLAREPMTALGIMALSIVVGTISGIVVDMIHGTGYLRVDTKAAAACDMMAAHGGSKDEPRFGFATQLWLVLVSLGFFAGIFVALQIDLDAHLGGLGQYQPTAWLGFIGGALSLTLFVFARDTKVLSIQSDNMSAGTAGRVVHDTVFVTTWVIIGFLSYELAVHFAGAGVERLFATAAPIIPLVAILIGFVPGCGPQVVVTTLYVNGIIPLSAQLGNAIANDGDALFPAIALAPRTALYATIYSAIPALIVAYGYYFLFE